jgi:hypothetical protein
MEKLSYVDALELVYQIAILNSTDEMDVEFGSGRNVLGRAAMEDMRDKQTNALDLLHDVVVNYCEEIDETFPVEADATLAVVGSSSDYKSDSQHSPSYAIQVCLEMAEQVSDEMVTEGGRQAMQLVERFLSLHALDLDSRIESVPTAKII